MTKTDICDRLRIQAHVMGFKGDAEASKAMCDAADTIRRLRDFSNAMRVTIKEVCSVCDEVYCDNYDEEHGCCIFDSTARSLGIEVKE